MLPLALILRPTARASRPQSHCNAKAAANPDAWRPASRAAVRVYAGTPALAAVLLRTTTACLPPPISARAPATMPATAAAALQAAIRTEFSCAFSRRCDKVRLCQLSCTRPRSMLHCLNLRVMCQSFWCQCSFNYVLNAAVISRMCKGLNKLSVPWNA